ncbi:zinc ribbon domain-containing protein [Halapricum desulfuricans]|uniref:DUF7577 domain-containing protein n=1 Tax=Halapricum desulfuricans TaxID=2841257 RepID=A0A897N057_9EURY|nr:zinc ribbon domain-containing protein [Halapricum desulfuricans]QSG04519.1 hypothetical protein HSR121_0160 [Halapricum desulfuricans]
MVPWEPLLVYALVLVWAALLGWLPFRLLERISVVDQIDASAVERSRKATTDSTVVCPHCGQPNDRGYTFCESCGGKLPTDWE